MEDGRMNGITARVLTIYGDNISTDDMTSGKFLDRTDPKALAEICMHDIDPDFPKRMAPGGLLVTGKNLGCGSSRETAPVALKECNVRAIIAEEYARIFYRNCINIGLPLIECPGISGKVELNDELEIDFSTGLIKNLTKNEEYQGSPIPAFLLEKVKEGGLMAGLKKWADEQWASGCFQ
jgi:3-isopropylmalate/(R)-2-methylmalate dehydratase small subunit